MAGLESTGLVVKTIQEGLAEIEEAQIDAISDELDVGPASPLGQMNAAIMRQIGLLWELAQEVDASARVSTASGAQLTDLCALTGTLRDGATYSNVACTVVLDAGTYAAGALVAHTTADPTARFANELEITTAGGTVTGVTFVAEDPGPVRANAGTLTVIAESVTGWTSITNPADAIEGALEESDTGLRTRQQQERAASGSTTVDAIYADLVQVEGVEYVSVLENDTLTTDGNGTPGKAIQCVVLGGADEDVARAIFLAKSAGIQAYGETTEAVEDSQGTAHTIGFTRPDVLDMFLEIELDVDPATWAGEAVLKQTLADWGDANLGVGDDVIYARVLAVVMGVPGVVDCPLLEIGDIEGLGSPVNWVVGATDIADFDTGRITVTVTEV